MDKGSIIGGIAIVVGAGIYAIDSELFFLLLAALIYMGIYLLLGVGYFNNDTIKNSPSPSLRPFFTFPQCQSP